MRACGGRRAILAQDRARGRIDAHHRATPRCRNPHHGDRVRRGFELQLIHTGVDLHRGPGCEISARRERAPLRRGTGRCQRRKQRPREHALHAAAADGVEGLAPHGRISLLRHRSTASCSPRAAVRTPCKSRYQSTVGHRTAVLSLRGHFAARQYCCSGRAERSMRRMRTSRLVERRDGRRRHGDVQAVWHVS